MLNYCFVGVLYMKKVKFVCDKDSNYTIGTHIDAYLVPGDTGDGTYILLLPKQNRGECDCLVLCNKVRNKTNTYKSIKDCLG